LLVAVLLHLLVLWELPPPELDLSVVEPPGEPAEDPIQLHFVDLAEMSPDAADVSAGRLTDGGEQPLTERHAPPDPVEPADTAAEGEPDSPPLDPVPDTPGFTLADITIEQPEEGMAAPTLTQQQRAAARSAAPVPSRAPEAMCSPDLSQCVFETGDVVELNAALVEAMLREQGSGIRVAESDAELQRYRQQFHHDDSAESGPAGMPLYRNYGRLPGKDKVDVERLSRAASGAPHNCRIYPDALLFESEQPVALYIVIDSSGSMTKNKYTSKATRCAWAAAESALEHDIPVGVINFSDKLYIAEETDDTQRLAEVICKSQRHHTLLPEHQLEEIVADSGDRRDLLLISDGAIQNLDAALPHLQSVLQRNASNRGIALLIDYWREQQATESLHGIGFRVTLLRF